MNKSFFLLIAVTLISCNTINETSRADSYMAEVKNETYTGMFLPDFEPSDIPALLTYRDDKQILKSHPCNPLSSYAGYSVTAGMIALWTIESIRITAVSGDTNGFKRFPSLNPIVYDSISGSDKNGILQDSVAQCYFDWWNNSTLNLNDKLLQNPLSRKNFRWF